MNARLQQYFCDNEAHAGLGRQSLHSGVVFLAARAVNIFVQVGSTIVLARLLSPHDYGLVAMVLAMVSFAPMLIDLGTTDASVQKTRITHHEVSALFWLNVAIGIALTLALAGGSGLIAAFYQEPALRNIALVSSINFIIAAASAQHYALMRRAMQFHRIAVIEIFANIASTVAAIAMAMLGYGYWSLVAKPVLTTVISAVGVWATCPWLPGIPRYTKDVREMVGFGANITGFTMTDFLARSADRIAIGYYFGAGPLGYFQNAFLLYDNLLSLLTQPLHNVAVSSMSKLRNSLQELRRSWETALSSLSFFSAVAFAVMAVTAQDVVVVLMGEKWAPAGPVLSIIAARGIAHVVERTLGWLHVAAGRSDRWMRWGFVSVGVQLVALFAGLPLGPLGIATTYAVATFCLFVPAITYAGRPVGIEMKDVMRAVGRQVIGGLVAMVVAFLFQYSLLDSYSPLLRIVISGTVCTAVYFSIVAGLFRVTSPIQIALSVVRDFAPFRQFRLKSSTSKA